MYNIYIVMNQLYNWFMTIVHYKICYQLHLPVDWVVAVPADLVVHAVSVLEPLVE